MRAEQVVLLLYKALATRTTRQATIRLGDKSTSLVTLTLHKKVAKKKKLFGFIKKNLKPIFFLNKIQIKTSSNQLILIILEKNIDSDWFYSIFFSLDSVWFFWFQAYKIKIEPNRLVFLKF